MVSSASKDERFSDSRFGTGDSWLRALWLAVLSFRSGLGDKRDSEDLR